MYKWNSLGWSDNMHHRNQTAVLLDEFIYSTKMKINSYWHHILCITQNCNNGLYLGCTLYSWLYKFVQPGRRCTNLYSESRMHFLCFWTYRFTLDHDTDISTCGSQLWELSKLLILFFGFTLTTNHHLRKRTIERLKEQYHKVKGT